jgi:hypothetical protein
MNYGCVGVGFADCCVAVGEGEDLQNHQPYQHSSNENKIIAIDFVDDLR